MIVRLYGAELPQRTANGRPCKPLKAFPWGKVPLKGADEGEKPLLNEER